MVIGSVIWRVAAIAVLLLLPGFARAAESYSFAVVPQYEQRRLFTIWKPILDEVARRAGVELRLASTLSVTDYERSLAAGAYDFVFTNPYHILRQTDRQGYQPLVRDDVPLKGILLVAKESPYRSLRDLDGKTLAVPSPNALGASILLRADLERLHGVHVEMRNVKTHASVYLHVANGLTEAGGGVQKVFEEQDKAVRDRLRILYTTREMPSHPVAAHPRVPAEARERVRHAFLDMAATPEGGALLGEVPISRPVATSMADYRVMLDWGLDAYWVEEPTTP